MLWHWLQPKREQKFNNNPQIYEQNQDCDSLHGNMEKVKKMSSLSLQTGDNLVKFSLNHIDVPAINAMKNTKPFRMWLHNPEFYIDKLSTWHTK